MASNESGSSTAVTGSGSRSTKKATRTGPPWCCCTAGPIRTCCGTVSFRCLPIGSASSATTTAARANRRCPKPVSAYSMARFSDDFAAVIDAMAPGQPVHVLAHDWGSIGMWEYLRRPGASDRVASFTSVSGPGADHLAGYIRGGLKRPYRPKTFSRALVQAMSIGYTVWLSVPVLAPLAVRTVHAPRLRRRLARRDGIPAAQDPSVQDVQIRRRQQREDLPGQHFSLRLRYRCATATSTCRCS